VTSRGVLYIAIGERYANAAVTSAQSVRRAMPNLAIAVASNAVVDGPFDHQITVSEADGYRAKIVGMAQTPFERTLMLDVDTYVIADIGELFELLDRFDMALAHAPRRFVMRFAEVPAAFAEFNTGVICYRRTPAVSSLFDDWLAEFDAIGERDQAPFRRVAYRAPEIRIATLTPEYNQRFLMAGFFGQPTKILHGWASESGYRKAAKLMDAAVAGPGMGVFAGHRVYDRHGRRYGNLPGRRSLLRRAPAGVRRRLARIVRRVPPAST
jgi:hypothetical protein